MSIFPFDGIKSDTLDRSSVIDSVTRWFDYFSIFGYLQQ